MTHEAKFKLGGLSHTLRIALELAPRIEGALDMGLFKIARLLGDQDLTTTQLAEIIRIGFDANGKVYTTEQVAAMMAGHEGYVAGMVAALAVVKPLFSKPESAGKKPQPGNGQPQANGSH